MTQDPPQERDYLDAKWCMFLGGMSVVSLFACILVVQGTRMQTRFARSGFPSDDSFFAILGGPFLGTIAVLVMIELKLRWWQPILFGSICAVFGAILLPIVDRNAGLTESLCVLNNWVVVGWLSSLGCVLGRVAFPVASPPPTPPANLPSS